MTNKEIKKMVANASKKVKQYRRFSENEHRNVIHGSNYKAYLGDITKTFYQELETRQEIIKSKVLSYTTDDAGNIDCFLDWFGEYIVYNTDQKKYFYWTGKMWREDDHKRIELWAQTAMRARRDYTLKKLRKKDGIPNEKELYSFMKQCCNHSKINAILEGAKPLISYGDAIFDSKRNLLNVLNGTIDLRSGVLKTHDKKDYITKLVPVRYDEKATAKRFDIFLKETFQDKDLIDYVQRLFGYCATGETAEQIIHFMIGAGANGKSTLLSLIKYIMCNYAEVIPAKVLVNAERAGAPTPELAKLPHKRLVCCSELNCTDVLNEGKVKILSSGETLPARDLFSSAFTFDPELKCIIDSNYLPQIQGTDHGIWRRIRVIPFYYTVAPENINKNLLDELQAERAGVLLWIVRGAIKYYSEGLEPCEIVKKETKQYRKAQDTLGSFIEACVREEEGSSVRARELYVAYTKFCEDNLLTPMSETKFGKDIGTRGFERGKDKISRKYLNIRLKKTA